MTITSSSSPDVITYLSERPRGDDVVHPLYTESAAQLDHLHVAFPCASERWEQETHGQSVVHVPQSVDERRIPVRITAACVNHQVESNRIFNYCRSCNMQVAPSVFEKRYCALPHLSFTIWSSLYVGLFSFSLSAEPNSAFPYALLSLRTNI